MVYLPCELWLYIANKDASVMLSLSILNKENKLYLRKYSNDIQDGKVNIISNINNVCIKELCCCIISKNITRINILNSNCLIIGNFENVSSTTPLLHIHNSICYILRSKIVGMGSILYPVHGIFSRLSTVFVSHTSINIYGHGACVYSIQSKIKAISCGFGNKYNKHGVIILKRSNYCAESNVYIGTQHPVVSVNNENILSTNNIMV